MEDEPHSPKEEQAEPLVGGVTAALAAGNGQPGESGF